MIRETATSRADHHRRLIWTDRLVEKFWDYYSTNEYDYFANANGQQIIKSVRKFFPKGSKVLDLGCGAGGLTRELLRQGFSVAACDYSTETVRRARIAFSENELFLGATVVEEILESGAKFDVIFLVEVVEHLNDQHLEATIQVVKRLLSSGGVLVVTTPNEELLDEETVYCPCCDHSFHRWQHVRSWSANALEIYFSKHAFRSICVKSTNFSLNAKDGFLAHWIIRPLRHILRRKNPHLMLVAKQQ